MRGSVEYLRGSVLDATSDEYAGPIPGTINSTLRGTAQASLRIQRPYGDAAVEIYSPRDGVVDARFEGKNTVTSQGDRQVLSVARALFSLRVQQSSIALLIYDEASGMDTPARRACWRYLVENLPGLRLGQLRTLIVVVRVSGLDFDLHCSYGRGFHYALLHGEMIRRRTDNSIDFAVARIMATSVPHTVLFLGAGSSASSGLPLGNSVRDVAIRRLMGSQTSDSFELAKQFRHFLSNQEYLLTPYERAQTIEDFASRLTLEQVVRVEKALRPGVPETLDDFGKLNSRVLSLPHAIGPGIKAIQRMAASSKRRLVIVEVNFDTLVEHEHEDLFERFATEEEFIGAPAYLDRYLSGDAEKVPLLKVHGSIEIPTSCVASAEQTANGLPRAKEDALMRLVGEDGNVPWIYIGASMRDTDLANLFARREFAQGVYEMWVAPYIPPTVHEFGRLNRSHIWRQGEDLHARSVTELADEFLRRLADRWTE
ncbi:hypothetical protein [Microbispora sp. CA-102843]|uniref:hypothetical protein n=1 Tax=Microbispora sp. CA-102843 TaxID=3239952 RepID=UPI003D8A23F5